MSTPPIGNSPVNANIIQVPSGEDVISPMGSSAINAGLIGLGALPPGWSVAVDIDNVVARIPTAATVEGRTPVSEKAYIYRTLSPGLLAEEEALSATTVDKVNNKFKEIKALFVADSDLMDVNLMDTPLEHIHFQVDTGKQTATYWIGDGLPVTVHLTKSAQYAVYHKHMEELNKAVGAETIHGTGGLEKFSEGVSGHSRAPSAFHGLDIGRVGKHSEMKQYATNLLKATHPAPSNEARDAMIQLSAAEAYRSVMRTFFDSEKKRLTKNIVDAKKAGNQPAPEDVRELKMVKAELELLDQENTIATNTVLVQDGPWPSSNLSAAEALTKAFEPVFEEATPDQQHFMIAAGALALTPGDQLLYQKYCDLHPELDYTKHLAPEQRLIAWVRDVVNRDKLPERFNHIKESDFGTRLAQAFQEAAGRAATCQIEIEKPSGSAISMKDVVAAWLSAHERAMEMPYTPPQPAGPPAEQLARDPIVVPSQVEEVEPGDPVLDLNGFQTPTLSHSPGSVRSSPVGNLDMQDDNDTDEDV